MEAAILLAAAAAAALLLVVAAAAWLMPWLPPFRSARRRSARVVSVDNLYSFQCQYANRSVDDEDNNDDW